MKLLVIDTETGGLDPRKHSILSIAGIFLDTDTYDTKELFEFHIKDEPFSVEDEAMKINKINLNEVAEFGLSPCEAVKHLVAIVQDTYGANNKITLAGHNVGFDIGFLKRLFRLSNTHDFEKYFSHRCIDTATIFQFLQLTKHAPQGAANLDALLKATGVEKKNNVRHTAYGDAILTTEALKNLIKKFKVIQ